MAQQLVLANPRRHRHRFHLLNPRRHRRHHRGYVVMARNPDGTFATAANPRRHRRHRRNPLGGHGGFFAPITHLGGRGRRRNPSVPTEGIDILDVAVALGAGLGVDLASNTYKSLTNQAAPSQYVILAVKAVATVAVGVLSEELLGRGSAGFLGGAINTMATAVDIAETQFLSQPATFPIYTGVPQTTLPAGALPLTAVGSL